MVLWIPFLRKSPHVSRRTKQGHYSDSSQLPYYHKHCLDPPLLLVCISSFGFSRELWKRLWVKSCVTVADFLLCKGFDCSLGDIFGQWICTLILYTCFSQLFLTYLPCCQWMLSAQSRSQDHPRIFSSFLLENDLMLHFLPYRTGKSSNSKLWLWLDGCSIWSWELSLQWNEVSAGKLCLSISSSVLDF